MFILDIFKGNGCYLFLHQLLDKLFGLAVQMQG